MTFFPTFVLDKPETLHNWNKQREEILPCNSDLFGDKLVRSETRLPDFSKTSEISKPEHVTGGNPFNLIAKICLTKNKSIDQRTPGRKYKAVTKEEARDWFCKHAGVKGKWGDDYTYPVASPVRDLVIHGIVDVNTFVVHGSFELVDLGIFTKAYNLGLGRRKSYGCGMIFVL